MSLIDNFKKNFGIGAGRPNPNDQHDDDSHAPSGLNSKPDGGKGATTLNKKPLVFAAAIIALVAAGAWGGMEMIGHQKVKIGGADNITPGHAVDVALPPSPPPKPPTWPDQATSTKKTPKKVASHKNGGTRKTAQTNTRETAQEKAEQTAFQQQMLVSSSGAWGQNGKQVNTNPGAAGGAGKAKSDGETGAAVYDTHIEHRPASPYEIMAGSVIPAVLTTSIQSDLPGQITAQVSRNIFDSESGAYLLIPAGAKLVGYYSNKIIAGQTRVGVDWTRIIMPDGAYINLGTMPGAGPSGKDGFHDEVNDHTWEIFKNALLMSIVDLGVSVSQPGYGSAGGYGQSAVSPAQQGEASLMQTFGQAEANILQRYTNIAPTLTIRAGYQLNVAVTKDVIFPGPYRHGAGSAYRGPSTPSGIAPATEFNPYPAKG